MVGPGERVRAAMALVVRHLKGALRYIDTNSTAWDKKHAPECFQIGVLAGGNVGSAGNLGKR